MPDKFPVYAIDADALRRGLVAHILSDWTPSKFGVEGTAFCYVWYRWWNIVDEKDFANCGVSHICKRCEAAYQKLRE